MELVIEGIKTEKLLSMSIYAVHSLSQESVVQHRKTLKFYFPNYVII